MKASLAKLAIKGGPKVRNKPFPKHPIIGEEEKKEVMEVLDSGNLSTFIANPGENFLGGKKIRAFEEKFSEYLGTKYAVAFNSASSALHAAVVAVGV
jgi:dTDP-4-amino-4,6-dideoxygalactose transaminase